MLRIWLEAIRLKTLPLAISSIVIGNVLAIMQKQFSVITAILSLLTAVLLQILSNLANDYGDAIKGTDNEDRIGPMRAMQSGMVSASQMQNAMILNVILIIITGCALIFYSLDSLENLLIFVAIGSLSIIAAIAYTVGKRAYGYLGLGDLAVFIFFGIVAVLGSHFLQTQYLNWYVLLPASAAGLLAVAVLNVNNMRDIDNDMQCGKYTLAVRLGFKRAKMYHTFLLLIAFAIYFHYIHGAINAEINLFKASIVLKKTISAGELHFFVSLPFTVVYFAIMKHLHDIYAAKQPSDMISMLPSVVRYVLFINLLFIVNMVLVRYFFYFSYWWCFLWQHIFPF